MLPAVRSELRKYFTTRMWWGMAIAFVAAAALFSALYAFMFSSDDAAGAPSQFDLNTASGVTTVYTAGVQIGYLLTLTVGVMVIGSEYRHKLATATFLATPRRWAVVAAKIVALTVISCFYGLLSLATAVAVGAGIMSSKGFDPRLGDGYVLRSLALSLLVLVVWSLIGLGIGVLIRNQVAALLIAVGFAWIIEPIAALGLGFAKWEWAKGLAKYFPSSASQSVLGGAQMQDPGTAAQVLSWQAGALTLVAYAAVMALLGLALTTRRDIG